MFVCPRCGSKHVTRLSTRKKWQCKGCRYQFSVTAGTIFHKTYVDLPRWMMAVWLMCNSPKGCSSAQIQRTIGVTYKTAWYMTHRIRKAMAANCVEVKLAGNVEADIGIVKSTGGLKTKQGRMAPSTYVLGMVSRDSKAIQLQVVKNLRTYEIERVFAKHIDDVEDIYTDQARSFGTLWKFGHLFMVNHSKEYVHGIAHTNNIESAWSLFKRGLTGIFHHVSAKHLQAHLYEFAFRYSHRDEKSKLMELVLQAC